MADAPETDLGPETLDGAPEVLTERKASPEQPYREGESDLVEYVEGMYEDARAAKRAICDSDDWDDDLACYWGDQWDRPLPSYRVPIVINEIKSLALQELSDLTDSRLLIYIQKDPQSTQRDDSAEHTIQTYWRRHFCDLTVMQAALDAIIFPLGFFQTGWDALASQGQGDVIYRHRDPRTVFPDADAETDEDLRYYVLEDVVDLIQLRRDFPETGWLVEPEPAYSMPVDGQPDRSRPRPGAGGGYLGPLYTQGPQGRAYGWRKARARMLTCVVDDDELVEEIHDQGGGNLKAVVRPKYPHRRMLILANRRILYNDDCPYHYAPMLTSMALQPRVHAYWPVRSVVAEYRVIQEAGNKLESLVVENALRMNLGETYADANCGVDPEALRAAIPGASHFKRPGSKIEKTYPPPMPPDMINGGERLRGLIRTNFGYSLARSGAGTHGNIAAELAETEISQSMGMTRLRGRLMYQSVQKSVEMLFARMAQFYTSPRHLPYIDGGELKSIKWEPIPADAAAAYSALVDESSFTVRSKTMMQRLFLTLARMNKMPTKRLLQALEIPDADKIAGELTQELALQALARQQQKGKGRAK